MTVPNHGSSQRERGLISYFTKADACARPHRWWKANTTVDITAGKVALPAVSTTGYTAKQVKSLTNPQGNIDCPIRARSSWRAETWMGGWFRVSSHAWLPKVTNRSFKYLISLTRMYICNTKCWISSIVPLSPLSLLNLSEGYTVSCICDVTLWPYVAM